MAPAEVVAAGHWMLFDHDTLRVAAVWSGEGFIDWNGINFNGRHQIHPRVVGTVRFANPVGPGWADPETGRFDDPRSKGRDGKPYGPLPRSGAQYLGMYHSGNQSILSYSVGAAKILEVPFTSCRPARRSFTRTLNIGKSPHELLMRVAPTGTAVALVGDMATLDEKDGYTLLRIPAAATPVALKLLLSDGDTESLKNLAKTSPAPASLEPFLPGRPVRSVAGRAETQGIVGTSTRRHSPSTC